MYNEFLSIWSGILENSWIGGLTTIGGYGLIATFHLLNPLKLIITRIINSPTMLTATAKANQALTKRHNARLVLKIIYDQGPVSRAEIARTTNLTATTVSSVIGR
jgi:hypothetical protein